MIRLSEAMARMYCQDTVRDHSFPFVLTLTHTKHSFPHSNSVFLLCLISHRLIISIFYKVQPKHVKEAFRLLNKSIIRVETPDIQFDDEEEQPEGMQDDVHIQVELTYTQESTVQC